MSHEEKSEVAQTRPIADRVLLRIDERKRKLPNGLESPEVEKGLVQVGVVIAKGAGRMSWKSGRRVPIEVGIGDKVVIKKYAGTEVRLDGVDHLIVFDEDIEGIAEVAA